MPSEGGGKLGEKGGIVLLDSERRQKLRSIKRRELIGGKRKISNTAENNQGIEVSLKAPRM